MTDERICVASGRLRWTRDGDDLVTGWGLSAGVALLGAAVSSRWLSTLPSFLLFMVAVALFLSSAVRCQAAINRSLLDPYRIREPWERPDWWNH